MFIKILDVLGKNVMFEVILHHLLGKLCPILHHLLELNTFDDIKITFLLMYILNQVVFDALFFITYW